MPNFFDNESNSLGINQNRKDTLNVFEIVKNKYIEYGVSVETKPEWRNVLAMRWFTPATKDTLRGSFDDKIIVTWITDEGQSIEWRFFDANTDPSYQYSEEGRKLLKNKKRGEGLDADGDGKNDLGVLPFGVYKYHAFTSAATNKDLGQVFMPITDDQRGIRVYRDINRDGNFTQEDEDLVKDEDKMYEGGTMYIHRGSRRGTKDGNITWSAGCQTIPYEDFLEFAKCIAVGHKAGQLQFNYVIVPWFW